MKKLTLPLSLLSLLFSAHIFAVEHELESAGQIDKFVIKGFPSQNAVVSSMSKQAITDSAITPICPTLATGSLYTLSNSQAGENVCYHFEITERSKTTALLVGQSTDTNVNLSILRHNPDDTFTTIGSSANAGNQDEAVIALTEPGHYYWFMEVIESDGSPYNFGAAVATNLDAYEFNDTVATSTILPERQNKIVGNMDSINDADYFEFTAVNGQNLSVVLEDDLTNEYFFEVYNSGWVPIPAYSYRLLSGLQPGQKINLRVRPNHALPANPENNYTLTLASIVDSFDDDISGESNVTRIPYSAQNDPYLTTQAYNTLSWSVVLRDSTGAPIEGAIAEFHFYKDVSDPANSLTVYQLESDENGRISEKIEFRSCTPNIEEPIEHTEYSHGYKNVWESKVEVGAWRLEIPTNKGLDENGNPHRIGIGGENVKTVAFGHICSQKLISSNPT